MASAVRKSLPTRFPFFHLNMGEDIQTLIVKNITRKLFRDDHRVFPCEGGIDLLGFENMLRISERNENEKRVSYSPCL